MGHIPGRVPYFSRDLENLSPNLSPASREALNSPPSLLGKGAGGLGFALVFPHDVKSQGRVLPALNVRVKRTGSDRAWSNQV
ncbi:hypothetical protein SD81_012870 [Tolypothrix campylonemoides VB511288]|nr:hypothetical protein SD81_012870 [Tolypothrix campylonemoides VB511288]